MSWDHVHDSRTAFRACLEALSRPGARIVDLPRPGLSENAAHEAAAGILLALLDPGLGLASTGGAETVELGAKVRELTGAAEVRVEEADFVFAGPRGEPDVAGRARRGSALAPDRGATLVYAGVDAQACELELAGPGVPGTRAAPVPLAAAEIETLRRANSHPPLGVDVLALAPDGSLVGLPRAVLGG
ncbi:MAG: phosphonate C-P lyase system protein PhnH [Solirubrobacterales bacterium]